MTLARITSSFQNQSWGYRKHRISDISVNSLNEENVQFKTQPFSLLRQFCFDSLYPSAPSLQTQILLDKMVAQLIN